MIVEKALSYKIVMVDEKVIDEINVELGTVSEGGLPIAPDIQGVHELSVYIDKKFCYSITYDFDTGEQVQ